MLFMDHVNYEDNALKFVDLLLKSDFEAATDRFDDQMNVMLPIVKLKDTWNSLTGEAGNLVDMNVTRFVEQDPYKVIIVRIQFERLSIDIQVVFNNKNQVSGLNLKPVEVEYHPPEYVDESLFKEVNITVGDGEWSLPGTLTIPGEGASYPGVVLVHGSGPQDRDETVGFNKVFRDLAWGLANDGIAVLRYEKRTLEYKDRYTPELVSKITVEDEVTDDAINAVKLLKNQSNISEVYLLGHSLGATMAPFIGEKIPDLAGLIIMAGITRPLEDVLLEQFTYLFNLDGQLTDDQEKQLTILKKQVERVKDPGLNINIPVEELPLGVSAAYWLSLRDYNPVQTALKLSMPILILQGRRDYQVLENKDFTSWKNGLESKSNVSFKLFPSLNHLFIHGKGRSTPEEYNHEGHVNIEVINTINEWIKNLED